jgi:hypothetical protein
VVAAVAAFQFTMGTFLAAASAASLASWGKPPSGSGPSDSPDVSARRVIVLKWMAALRLLSPSLVLTFLICLVLRIRLDTGAQFWSGIPVLIGYMLAAGAAAASLGVALWSRWPRTRSPVTIAVVAWALLNAAFLPLASVIPDESFRKILSMSSPFAGVWMLVGAIALRNDYPFETVGWAIAWTVAFSIAAAHLMRAALASRARARSPLEPVEIDCEVPA